MNPNDEDFSPVEALLDSASHGDLQGIQKLIDAGVDVNSQNEEETALLLASINGHSSVVSSLIKLGANINHQNQFVKTALILAVTNGHIDVVKELMKAKADKKIADQGNTAMDYAKNKAIQDALK
ncbi:ankyrin repeat protein [Anaeramoeba ignava]|uniref:Ankyrin repeat protein n=1 Tax=Anaeramoeba ignava TaxID=1746090 RepID=A0A9Q0LMP0_ANAIG|nr:ankyrin repeat protein [Anaeramoeba ignava]